MPDKLKVVTIATDTENEFLTDYLIPSCAAHNIKLVILKPHSTSAWKGFSSKKTTISRYLQKVANEDELILFTDAYDTLINRDEDYILEVWHKQKKDILFSGETNCWPMGVIGFALYGQHQPSTFPYLNSGGYLGRVSSLLNMIKKYSGAPVTAFPLLKILQSHGHNVYDQYWWSDQFYWTLVYLLEREKIGIDHDGAVFEFLGPIINDMDIKAIVKQEQEYEQVGKIHPLYIKEYARLSVCLAEPSSAAQLHFASKIAKCVFVDMKKNGELPGWLAEKFSQKAEPGYAQVVVV